MEALIALYCLFGMIYGAVWGWRVAIPNQQAREQPHFTREDAMTTWGGAFIIGIVAWPLVVLGRALKRKPFWPWTE